MQTPNLCARLSRQDRVEMKWVGGGAGGGGVGAQACHVGSAGLELATSRWLGDQGSSR